MQLTYNQIREHYSELILTIVDGWEGYNKDYQHDCSITYELRMPEQWVFLMYIKNILGCSENYCSILDASEICVLFAIQIKQNPFWPLYRISVDKNQVNKYLQRLEIRLDEIFE